MPPPIESLARSELENRYRILRTITIVLCAVLIATFGFLLFGNLDSHAASPQAEVEEDVSETSEQAAIERRVEGDPMAIGDVDAPVVLSEWIDFRCPYCAVYARDTFPSLVQEYVDTGQVRIEVHDMAFFGEESLRAAAAARAAGEQGKYFEFVAAVYEAAPETGHPELPEEQLVGFAEAIGVPDIDKFRSDMNSDELRSAVQQSTEVGSQLGVTGVPFFVVNGKGLSGAQPIDTFRQLIEQSGA